MGFERASAQPHRSHQLHAQLAPDDVGGTQEAFDRRAAVIGIKQKVDLRPACLHEFGHPFLVMRFFFISSASWRAITALIAAAVTSERIPASSSQLSKLDPIWRCFLVMTTPPSYVPVPALILPAGSSALS